MITVAWSHQVSYGISEYQLLWRVAISTCCFFYIWFLCLWMCRDISITSIILTLHMNIIRGSSYNIKAKVVECHVVVSKFPFQSIYYALKIYKTLYFPRIWILKKVPLLVWKYSVSLHVMITGNRKLFCDLVIAYWPLSEPSIRDFSTQDEPV